MVEFEPFVQQAVALAAALQIATQQVPAPAQLAAHADAWRAFAQKVGGRFEAGGFAVREVTVRGAPVELVTRYDATGVADATVARALLPRALSTDPDLDALSPETRRLLQSLKAECDEVKVTRDAVEAALPCPLAAPARAVSVWRGLIRVAKACDE